MQITDVQITLQPNASDRLRAFVSFVVDDWLVVHDARLIEGPNGLFVAMPTRKATRRCTGCGHRVPFDELHCGNCGTHLGRALPEPGRRTHSDVVHPINASGRELIHTAVVEAYQRALTAPAV